MVKAPTGSPRLRAGCAAATGPAPLQRLISPYEAVVAEADAQCATGSTHNHAQVRLLHQIASARRSAGITQGAPSHLGGDSLGA